MTGKKKEKEEKEFAVRSALPRRVLRDGLLQEVQDRTWRGTRHPEIDERIG